jgi:AcrR family transcriptional regulator
MIFFDRPVGFKPNSRFFILDAFSNVIMEKYLKQLTQKELGKMNSIAKAAAKLFNEKGYLETSMDDISTAAKLSKGGIYHYFSSKNEILYFISTHFMGLLLKDLEQALDKVKDNFEIRVVIAFFQKSYPKTSGRVEVFQSATG